MAALAGIGFGVLPRGDGSTAAPSPEGIALDVSTRSEFVQNLAAGGRAGIAAYLVTHGSPPQLWTAHRFCTIERSGTDPGWFSLTEAPPETDAGRATVFLVLEVSGRSMGRAPHRAADEPPVARSAVAGRNGDQQGGELTIATFRYSAGSRPARLQIEAHAGVRWGAAVVFSD